MFIMLSYPLICQWINGILLNFKRFDWHFCKHALSNFSLWIIKIYKHNRNCKIIYFYILFCKINDRLFFFLVALWDISNFFKNLQRSVCVYVCLFLCSHYIVFQAIISIRISFIFLINSDIVHIYIYLLAYSMF